MIKTLRHIAMICLLWLVNPALAYSLPYAEGTTWTISSQIDLAPHITRHFKKYYARKNVSFSSYFVTTDGSFGYGGSASFSRHDADLVGRIMCEAYSQRECVLYARGEPSNSFNDYVVPKHAQKTIKQSVSKTAEGRLMILAISPTGSYGTAIGFDDPEAGIKMALSKCLSAVASARAKADQVLRDAFDKQNIYRCRIINFVLKT